DWIDRLRMPNWLFYLLLTIVEFLLYYGLNRVIGFPANTPLESMYAYVVLYNIGGLAFIHYMRRTAKRVLEDFAPALGASDAEFMRLNYQLTVLPAIPTLIATVLGAAFTFADALDPASQALQIQYPPAVLVFAVLGLAVTGVMLLQIVRLLIMVNRIHRLAQRINLFQFDPLYSFSGLTVRIGLFVVIGAYFNLAIDPNAFASPSTIALNGVLLLIGAAAFVLPLNSMHQRIVQEKKRLLAEHDQRFESVVNELNQHIDARNLEQVDVLTRTMNSLVIQREVLNKIPTWPWRTVTFRGFATTLLLPLVVWLITRLLSRLGL
ncbi:MAG TPA: hypothetical protein VFF70_01050, partial [Anaerolineae bacterium]|nr:hypothetical protein [Anaerolineae bacterium]